MTFLCKENWDRQKEKSSNRQTTGESNKKERCTAPKTKKLLCRDKLFAVCTCTSCGGSGCYKRNSAGKVSGICQGIWWDDEAYKGASF